MRRRGLWTGLVLLLVLNLSIVGAASELTGAAIMERVDANMHFESSHSTMEMVIQSGRREMVKEMIIWSEGEDSLVEFTNPGDRGTKYLKLDDELWMFFPDAEDLVRISGHMLRQGFMGSDMSYEDMMVSDKLTELYSFELVGEETLGDRQTYVVEAKAQEGAEVSYAQRRVWVDTDSFVPWREELYAVGGRLLKVMEILETAEIDGRTYPMEMAVEDKLKQDSRTYVRVKDIEFDVDIPDDLLSLDSLTF